MPTPRPGLLEAHDSENDLETGFARPFVKWVGGKRQVLDHLVAQAPKKFGTYYEPFVGGGALFWRLKPERAVLSDMNLRLIRTYRGIRDSVHDVIRLLRSYPYEKDFFLDLRKRAIDGCSDAEVAAWFVYLNKAGFNGLYRVNSKNIFNVPFGRYTSPSICDERTLRACAKALAGADIRHGSFETVTAEAVRGDFVYFDPPYIPVSDTSFFTAYTADGFDWSAQQNLRNLALELKDRGVRVLLSNSSAPAVYELYKRRFKIIEINATRLVNATVAGRGTVVELLIK